MPSTNQRPQRLAITLLTAEHKQFIVYVFVCPAHRLYLYSRMSHQQVQCFFARKTDAWRECVSNRRDETAVVSFRPNGLNRKALRCYDPAVKPRLLITAMLAILPAGCPRVPKATLDQQDVAMVYVLPGIEGRSVYNANIAKGLVRGGFEGAVEIYDWTTRAGPFGWLLHLAYHKRNRIKAIELARRIAHYEHAHPNRPVFLIAHSGGADVALMAAENLPVDVAIDGIILLAGAVSRDHNLTAAMEHTQRGIWNYYSTRDVGFLMIGTTVFGTSDRRFRPSAGALGFKTPPDLSPRAAELYEHKLFQVPYSSDMSKTGHYGGHTGWARPKFVAKYLAPIVCAPTNEEHEPSNETSHAIAGTATNSVKSGP